MLRGKVGQPDFARLFASDQRQILKPGQARLLHVSLSAMAGMIDLDLIAYGGEPITFDSRHDRAFTATLPPFTWRQSRKWRERLLDAAEDLIDDLERGEDPAPRCPAEEVLVRLAIEDAKHTPQLTEKRDRMWDLVLDQLFQDADVELILWPGAEDGVLDDPVVAARIAPADYRAEAWFNWFLNVEPRPSRR